MDTKKKAKLKTSKGRHAAGAHANRGSHAAPEPGISKKTEEITDDNQASPAAEVEPEQAASFANQPMLPVVAAQPKSKGKALKIVAIVLGAILGLIVLAYLAGSIFFMGRFFPQTSVGEFNVSMMTAEEAQQTLAEGLNDYRLSVKGEGLNFSLTAKDAGLVLNEKAILEKALQEMNPWMWPFELQKTHDESDKLAASYNDSGLGDVVKVKVDEFNEAAKQPIDATIAYNKSLGAYAVEPEELGTALDYEAVLKVVDEAMVAMEPTATVTKQALLKPPVLSTDAALQKACDSANTMIKANLELMMGPSIAATVGPDQLSSWITFDEEYNAALDEGLMTTWIDELATACNTLGTSRTYTRPDGKVITVSGGTYGWVVDHEALMSLVKDGVAAGEKGQFDIPVSQSAGQFAGAGGRDWGNSYVDIDLAEQYARYYDDSGNIIWESAIVSGIPDGIHNTPAGVYMLNSKASPSKLIGWENGEKIYETDVSYWLPFVGNVIGLHDANWQSSFGGTRYADGFGSHGCVNLPFSAAQTLYNMIPVGIPVISHW